MRTIVGTVGIVVMLVAGLLASASRVTLAEPPAAAPTRLDLEVRGTVQGTKGKPLAGASVWIWSETTALRQEQTGAEGKLRLELEPARYSLVVQAERHAGFATEVELLEGKDTPVLVDLTAGIPVDGRVVGRDGKPLAGAELVVVQGGTVQGEEKPDTETVWGRALTNEDGRFHVMGVPADTFATIKVWADGHEEARVVVRATADGVRPSPLVIQAIPKPCAQGKVTGPDGKPIANATVFVIRDGDPQALANPWAHNRAWTARTSEDGAYLVPGLSQDEPVLIGAQAGGHVRYGWQGPFVSTAAVRDLKVDVALKAATRVILLVTDERGVPRAGAEVLDVPEPAYVEQGTPPGVIAINELEPGPVRLAIRHAEHPRHSTTVEATAGATVERTVALPDGVTIAGRLLGPDGRPASGSVTASGDLGSKSAVADEHGAFTVKGLVAGPHVLTVEAGRGLILVDSVAVPAPSTAVELRLVALGRVRFRLPLRADETPEITQLSVLLPGQSYADTATYETEPDGSHWFAPPRGPSRLIFETPDLAPISRDVEVALGGQLDLGTLRFEVGSTLHARVVDAAGNAVPLASARVAHVLSAAADDEGRFQLEHVPAGKVEVELEAPDYLSQTLHLDVAGARVEHTFVLYRGGVLSGTVRIGEYGGGSLYARPTAGGKTWEQSESAPVDWSTAQFELRLAPGRYQLLLVHGPHQSPLLLGEAAVKEGETVRLELTKSLGDLWTAAEWLTALEKAPDTGRLAPLRALLTGDRSPAVAAATAAALASESREVRQLAAELLGLHGALAAFAVPALIERLDDSEPLVCAQAALALAVIPWGSHPVEAALLARVEQGDGATGGEDRDLAYRTAVLGPALGKALASPDAKTPADVIAAQLKSPRGDLRAMALLALGGMGAKAKGAVPAILAALDDPEDRVQRFVPVALKAMRPPPVEAVAVLAQRLRGNPHGIGAELVRGALAALGKAALPALLEMTKDPNLVQTAIYALGDIGPEAAEALPQLFELLKTGKASSVDSTIVGVGPEALAFARNRLSNPADAPAALKVIALFFSEAYAAVPEVLAILDDAASPHRAQAAGTLAVIATKAIDKALVLPRLMDAARNGPPELRAQALAGVVTLGGNSAELLPSYLAGLRDAEAQVRKAGVLGLATFRTQVTGEMTAALVTALRDAEPDVRWFAAEALGKTERGSADVVTALAAALADPHPQVQVQAAKALGKFGKQAVAAVPALEQASKHANELVAKAAAEALVLVGKP